MPIRFRCGYCNKLLGIARRKAGTETTCPHCGYSITVPDEPNDDQTEMVDLDDLMNPLGAVDHTPLPATNSPARDPTSPPAERPKAQSSVPSARNSTGPSTYPDSTRPGTRIPQAPVPEASSDNEPNVDLVFSTEGMVPQESASATPPSAVDAALKGSGKSQIVLSVTKATAILVGVVLLVALAFASGFLLASMK